MMSLLCAAVLSAKGETLRLNLQRGASLRFTLQVTRENPNETGIIQTLVSIKTVQGGVHTMDATLTGLSINGKDRAPDLKAMLTRPTVTFSWTNRAQRTGAMTGIQMGRRNDELLPLLAEAGLYLCEFPRGEVQPGASWDGSVTATGGCTSGRYKLKEFRNENGRRLAAVEVSNIAYFNATEVTPMRMVVDLKTGVPELVEYTAKSQDGRKSHFVQKLISTSPK